MNPREPFRLGEVVAWPASNEVDAGRGRVRIPPRLMALLVRLVRAGGDPVDRATLIDEVWSRRGVTDEVLSRAIAELRTALGDDAKTPRYIETLPKVGYRLVAAAEPLALAAAGEATVATTAQATAPLASSRSFPRPRTSAIVAGLAILVALAFAWRATRAPADPVSELRRQLAAATVLVGGDDLEVAPRFSPDGKRIAYATGRSSSRIVIEDRATRERKVVGPEGGLQVSPAFLPGGERVVYLRSIDNDCGIIEAGVDDWRVRAPCPPGMRQRFDLAPDGSRIVASAPRQPDRPPALVEVDLATGAQRWLTEPEPGGGGDTQPRYAPDGKRIAFFRGTESHRELWLLDRDSAQVPRRVGTQSGLVYGSAFLPGARALLVSADWPGFRALNRVDLATGREELVGARGARFPDVAANGDIVFELATYKANLWRIDPSGAREAAIAWPSPRYTGQPELDPDGKRVVFVSNRDGGEALYVAPIDGEATRVPGGDDWRTTRARWSADGRALYAVRTKRGEPASDSTGVRIDPLTGETTALAWLGGRVHDVTPAPDGRTLYMGELAGHAMRMYRTGVDGGALERLPLPLASQFRVAGDLLAFAQPQLRGLTVCRMPELACRSLPVPVDDSTRFDWTLAPDAIWVHVSEGGSANLVRFDPASGRETLRLPLGPSAPGTNIAAGPGGVPLFVSREAPVEIDLMVAPRQQ